MKSIKYIYYILPVITTACSWLDVGTKSEVDADEMFLTTEGYYTALTGVYVNMGNAALYGGYIPLSAIESLTQQYILPSDDTDRSKWGQYDYTTPGAKSYIDEVWGEMYNTIVNCNLLLENLRKEDCPEFEAGVWEVLTGEAIGLRAYMFFDLLRIYNESYLVNPQCDNVPLKKDFGFNLGEQITTEKAMELLMEDLEYARELLKDNDPISTNKIYEDKYLSYDRSQRMNYYAVTALMARMKMYRGDYASAYDYACEVIESTKFKFIETDKIIETDMYGKELKVDRIFMPEMIFALANDDILSTSRSSYESLNGDFIKSDNCYDADDVRRNWLYTNPSAKNKINLIRYQRSTLAEDAYKYHVSATPMLKLGEMYLILAESVLKDASIGGVAPEESLNVLKGHRNAGQLASGIDAKTIDAHITREYICEFKGEGQLFFYYKRRNEQAVDDGHYTGNTIKMRTADYTWPLPEYEQDFGYGN